MKMPNLINSVARGAIAVAAAAAVVTVGALAPAGVMTKAQASAKKVSVYVVTKEVSAQKNAPATTYKYAYNKKGLVKSVNDGYRTNKATYNAKNRLVKYGTKSSGYTTYTYKGSKLVGATKKSIGLKTKYTYSGSKLSKVALAGYGSTGWEWYNTVKLTVNKKGQLTKCVEADGTVITFSYDKHGILKKACHSSSSVSVDGTTYTYTITGTYKNTYNKKGLLTKQVQTWINNNNGSCSTHVTTVKFKYKKISVSKSLLTKVKKQRLSFLNDVDYMSDMLICG